MSEAWSEESWETLQRKIRADAAWIRTLIARGEELERKLEAAWVDLVKAQRRGSRRCEHHTANAPGLPCPHPDCWSGGQVFLQALPGEEPLLWQPELTVLPMAAAFREKRWERRVLTTPDGPLWGWWPR